MAPSLSGGGLLLSQQLLLNLHAKLSKSLVENDLRESRSLLGVLLDPLLLAHSSSSSS